MKARSLIVKFGTESLMKHGRLSKEIISEAAAQIADLIAAGVAVTIVSSGAIQAGRQIAARLPIGNGKFSDQALAGIGSARLVCMWQRSFGDHGLTVAQFPVTYANFECAEERASILSNITEYHRSRVVVPNFNVNDVATRIEIDDMQAGISENDRLLRVVSDHIGADCVVFVTSVGGVYDSDPRVNPEARMYEELDVLNLPPQVAQSAGKSSCGNGGMERKLPEAVKCCISGRRVCIANLADEAIVRFAYGESVGTLLGQENRFYA